MKRKVISIELNGVIRNIVDKIIEIYENEKDLTVDRPLSSLDLEKELDFSTKEELIDFIYIESPMRVFGYSKEIEESSIFIINEIYKKFRDEYKIIIFSNEVEKSKPATLMFLARTGCLIDNVQFFPLEDYDSIWKNSDIVISALPAILDGKPKNKISIKYENPYNEDIKADFNITSLKQLLENEYFTTTEFA
jgi:hypothetical protein